jgi:CHAT domain-containing protein
MTALLRARSELSPTAVCGSNLVLLHASNTSSGNLLALPSVETEITLVAKIAEGVNVHFNSLSQAGATNKEMAEALKSAHIVHIACHGIQDPIDPLQSAFHFSDDRRLTVSDLMGLGLEWRHAFLAFLSACETAKGDHEQPSQAIHLAAAMLFAGFRSVVGTMW